MLARAFPVFTPVDSGRLAKEISLAKLNEGSGLVDSYSYKFNVQNYKGGGLPITTQAVIEMFGEADLPNAGSKLRFNFDGNPSMSIGVNAVLDLRNDTDPGSIFFGTTSEPSQTIGYASTNGGEITIRGDGAAILGIHSGASDVEMSIAGTPTISLSPLGTLDLRHATVGQGEIKFGADSGLANSVKFDSDNFLDEAVAVVAGGASIGIGMGKAYVLGEEDDADMGGDMVTGSTLYFEKLVPWNGDFVSIGGQSGIGDTVRVRTIPFTVKTAGTLLNIGNDDGSGNFSSRAYFDFDGNLSILGPSASAGTSIKLRRTDGTIVTITVDNTNTVIAT